MKESVFYQMILEEGEAKGEAKWKAEEARQILFRQGRLRFGPPDQDTASVIESTASLSQLESWLDRVLFVSSWEELLGAIPQSDCDPVSGSIRPADGRE